jgi:hypothetical protein
MYRTQGLDIQISVLLSQAAAHPRRGTNNTRNGKPARNERHATQQARKKQRGKTIVIAGFYARNTASKTVRVTDLNDSQLFRQSCKYRNPVEKRSL